MKVGNGYLHRPIRQIKSVAIARIYRLGEFNRINWADFVGAELGDGDDGGGQCGGFVALEDDDVHPALPAAGGDNDDASADDVDLAAAEADENRMKIIVEQRDKLKKRVDSSLFL